jgi:hypothetical protein
MLVGTATAMAAGAIVVFLFLSHGHHVDYGDVPTWLALIAAAGAGWIALSTLRGQQKDFERQVTQLERQQADAIDLTGWSERAMMVIWPPGNGHEQPKAILSIENKSSRPIRNIRGRIWPQEESSRFIDAYAKGFVGRDEASGNPCIFSPVLGGLLTLMKPGHWFGLLFDEEFAKKSRFSVRFVDDAGLQWQIDQDLHLRKIEGPIGW